MEPKIDCLQRGLQCPTIENESCVLTQCLQLTPPTAERTKAQTTANTQFFLGQPITGVAYSSRTSGVLMEESQWPAAPVPPEQTWQGKH